MAKGYNARPSASGGNMMSQLAKLQEQMAQAQDEIANETVTETSGGGAVAMVAYGALKMRDQVAAFGLPVPSAENIGDLLPRIPEFLGTGAMAWGGGAFVLLLTALIGFPSRR